MSEFSFTEVYLRHVFESLSKYSVNLGIFVVDLLLLPADLQFLGEGVGKMGRG